MAGFVCPLAGLVVPRELSPSQDDEGQGSLAIGTPALPVGSPVCAWRACTLIIVRSGKASALLVVTVTPPLSKTYKTN